MAADTRPYKSKEQDGQGNEVIIRDQQLVEQSTVTTMPSGACFETLDIDGRPVKIPRDNMMSIVLECIGIVLNDSSKNLGTNVNKALGLQGNTIGNVTVNDFASVLGVGQARVETKTIPANGSGTLSNSSYCLYFIMDYDHNLSYIVATSYRAVEKLDASVTKGALTFTENQGTLTITNTTSNTVSLKAFKIIQG